MTAEIYLIAGEPSGDRLGAALIRALRAEAPEIRCIGLGGQAMRAEGLEPLFDISEIAVMGLTEVIPRLPVILRRLRQVREDVLARRPAALVTIDAPSFGLRVARAVRAADPSIRTIHYVAPSVWAWRPGRAAKMAKFVDHVLALLPFEPPYMQAAGMTCDFVGHPIAERPLPSAAEIAAARVRLGVPGTAPLLLVAPGSRMGEVGRLSAPLAEVVALLARRHPGLTALVPVAETVAGPVTDWAASLPVPAVTLAPDLPEAERLAAFAAADAGLVKSGTVTLELAAMGVPMAVAYRLSWLTATIVRSVVRVDTVVLVNLVTGRKVVPEFLQEHLVPERVAEALSPLLAGGAAADSQRAGFDEALALLGRGGEAPSLRAARSVLSVL